MNHARVWALAAPMVVANVSTALLGLVDTAVIGHLNQAYYLGGIALGSIIFHFLYWGMGFLRMSTTGMAAQAYGRQQNDACRTILLQSMVLALFIASLMLILQRPILDLTLYLLQGSSQVKHYASTYFIWAIWGAPAMFSIMVISGWLLGMQNARATLQITIIVNLLNIILDIFFVFGLNMDVRGVALATVISLYTGLVLAVILVFQQLKHDHGKWGVANALNLPQLKRAFSIHRGIFIRTICLISVFAFFTRQGAQQGDTILAANAVLLNFQLLLALALDGLANAVEALVGKSHGSKDREQLRIDIKTVFFWSTFVAIGFFLSYALAGQFLINLLTDLPLVRQTAYEYLPWLIISPLISVWCFVLDGIFIGATKAQEMCNSMLISTFLIFLPAWLIFSELGNHGLWLALTIFFAARGITLLYTFIKIERSSGFINT